jgi:hypothetical protein
MSAPAARLTRGERLVAEFAGKQALLVTLIAEPALRAQVALASLGGTKEHHYEAASQHSRSMLRALTIQYGPPKDVVLTRQAARYGNLECLTYLHDHECPWDAQTTANAAAGGHLWCLRYAHEHGCAWDEQTITNAVENDRVQCLHYAYQNNCPIPPGERDSTIHTMSGKRIYTHRTLPLADPKKLLPIDISEYTISLTAKITFDT